MILYDYCRSSAAYRVRIALNLKAFKYQQISVNLVTDEHCETEHQQRNTQKLVPVLEDNQVQLSQSLAICEYLDEAYIQSYPLVAGNPVERAKIRAFAQAIACETHPLNNLRVLKFLASELKQDEEQRLQWYHHWIHTTFSALEQQLRDRTQQYQCCFSENPSLAEVCLIPQIFNAKRFKVDMSPYPLLSGVDEYCQTLESFQKAHPNQQVDA